jgi:hypothetical protein
LSLSQINEACETLNKAMNGIGTDEQVLLLH